MKTVYRTYKFRMYPSADQRQVLARYFGSVRFIYNHYLAERKRQYEETGKSDGYAKQAKDLVTLKRGGSFTVPQFCHLEDVYVHIPKFKEGLTEFAKEHPDTRQILVSKDRVSRRSGNVDLYYVTDFFKALWAGEVI